MNWYPLLFTPVYKEIIWGGKQLWNYLERKVPFERTAESWEISSHPEGVTKVSNGPLKGKTLSELTEIDPFGLLGGVDPEVEFPLLIKLIGAERDLSIQVHPNNQVGQNNGALSKKEYWYVLKAKQNARIICGLKPDVNKDNLVAALKTGKILPYVNQIPVKVGDFIPIPAGCLHSLGAGILALEIKQSSDITYRLYDWGRNDINGKPRPLNLMKGLEAINNKLTIPNHYKGCLEEGLLFTDGYLTISLYQVSREKSFLKTNILAIWTVVEGSGTVSAGGEKVCLVEGSSVLLPAGIREVKSQGDFKYIQILPTYVFSRDDTKAI